MLSSHRRVKELGEDNGLLMDALAERYPDVGVDGKYIQYLRQRLGLELMLGDRYRRRCLMLERYIRNAFPDNDPVFEEFSLDDDAVAQLHDVEAEKVALERQVSDLELTIQGLQRSLAAAQASVSPQEAALVDVRVAALQSELDILSSANSVLNAKASRLEALQLRATALEEQLHAMDSSRRAALQREAALGSTVSQLLGRINGCSHIASMLTVDQTDLSTLVQGVCGLLAERVSTKLAAISGTSRLTTLEEELCKAHEDLGDVDTAATVVQRD